MTLQSLIEKLEEMRDHKIVYGHTRQHSKYKYEMGNPRMPQLRSIFKVIGGLGIECSLRQEYNGSSGRTAYYGRGRALRISNGHDKNAWFLTIQNPHGRKSEIKYDTMYAQFNTAWCKREFATELLDLLEREGWYNKEVA